MIWVADMKILIACEYSGVERDAFTRAGHDAMSCDLLPTESPGNHYQGPVQDLMGERFDMVIAHPPCQYLSNSGVRWLYEQEGRWEKMLEGADFFALMFEFNADRLVVENPIQHRYAIERHGMGKPDQYVEPWEHGHTERKATGLWLRGVDPLKPTNDVWDEMMKLPYGERNRIHYASPGVNRSKIRSKSYSGIAEAMADQWGKGN